MNDKNVNLFQTTQSILIKNDTVHCNLDYFQRTPNGFSEEILRCKAIINTFHLVPPPSRNFFSTLISLVVRAEKYLNVEVGSPFQVRCFPTYTL